MSSDMAQTLLCIAFTGPAIALLVFSLLRKEIGGTDIENSQPLLADRDAVQDSVARSKGARRLIAFTISICLALISLLTILTLVVASHPAAAGPGKCPLGF